MASSIDAILEVVFTPASELDELRRLLIRWPANGGPTQIREVNDAAVNN